jgi:hypothetical protein
MSRPEGDLFSDCSRCLGRFRSRPPRGWITSPPDPRGSRLREACGVSPMTTPFVTGSRPLCPFERPFAQ